MWNGRKRERRKRMDHLACPCNVESALAPTFSRVVAASSSCGAPVRATRNPVRSPHVLAPALMMRHAPRGPFFLGSLPNHRTPRTRATSDNTGGSGGSPQKRPPPMMPDGSPTATHCRPNNCITSVPFGPQLLRVSPIACASDKCWCRTPTHLPTEAEKTPRHRA